MHTGPYTATSDAPFSEQDSNLCSPPVPGKLGEGVNDWGVGDGLPPGSRQGGQLRGSDSHPEVTLSCSSPVFVCAK